MASAGQVVLVPVQVSAMSHPPTAARHTVPAFPAACVHVGAPTVPLHTSAVHTLPSSVQLVPAAFTVSGGQLALWGASAMSWPMVAVLPVDAFEPLAPAAACATSALSEAALVELDVSAWNRWVMPVGAPIAEPSLRPKQPTSIVLATVVVIDGVELLTCPPDALMGLVVSTLEYALIPPATREDETVKAYGPGSAATVPATFQYVDTARFCPLLVVLTINVQPAGGVIVGTLELPWAVINATMTSLATVAAGLLMLSDVALPALPLLALVAPRNPMLIAPGQVSATSHSFATARHTAPALPAGCVHVALVPLHTSVVHALPSSVQVVPLALKASVGQAVVTPSQVSARSHSAAAARHTVPADLMASVGQVALVPVQFSAASQRSTAARQTVLEGRKALAGQVVLVPVQVSAASQGPAAARHTVPALPAGCVQVALAPLQMSRVQTLPSSVHAVPFVLKVSVGQVVLVPVQLSGRSHSPAAARHSVPAFPAGCVQVLVLPSH